MSLLWLNRPDADSRATAAALFEVATLIAPLTEITTRPVTLDRMPDALLLTSRHAVHALPAGFNRPVFCVGGSTADAARAAGATHIIPGEGDVLSLLPRIAETLPAHAELLYLSGEDIALDPTALLAAKSIRVTRAIAYDAQAVTALPSDVLARWSDLTAVAFYSARSVQIANTLIAQAGLSPAHIDAYCLSLNVVQAAALAPWKSLQAAHMPTQAAMLSLLAGAR